MRRLSPRRLRNNLVTAFAVAGALSLNASVAGAWVVHEVQHWRQDRPAYRAVHGDWSVVQLPREYRLQAVHAALLPTGKVLLIAGSGNDRAAFAAGTFTTVVWDPMTGATTPVPTPEDLFCGGHAYLPNGDLLVAGGTSKYEVLADKVTRAAGALWLKNEKDHAFAVRKGDVFVRGDGQRYVATENVTVPAARGDASGAWVAGESSVWIEAEKTGSDAETTSDAVRFDLLRLTSDQQRSLFGFSNEITLEKQNYRGLRASYVFDVSEERYVATEKLTFARWYPTLVSLNGGDILAVSGLDEHGVVLDGQNEIFDVATHTWNHDGKVDRFFPTYPSLIRMGDGRLFYSGSSTGYGSLDQGRQPGIWDVSTNTWQDVRGLRDADMTETSTSVLLPPAQDQRVAIVGGGAVGEGDAATDRIDVVDLDASGNPRYRTVARYPSPARYVSAVTLPDDQVLLTGGSRLYRGKSLSDLHRTVLFDPATAELTQMVPNEVGRNYHSTAVLLPDGRVMTMGSDPLFGDADNHTPGHFETRIEVFTPPNNYLPDRPSISHAPAALTRGDTVTLRVQTVAPIDKVRLIRPSAVTHLTDTEQRSVAAPIVRQHDGRLRVRIDASEGILPTGPYMLFVVDDRGAPSVALWVDVS
jgi:hypothetical protein